MEPQDIIMSWQRMEPGMKEALDKYLELQPSGQFAEAAKGMLQVISTTVQTDYSNPNAPKKGVKKK